MTFLRVFACRSIEGTSYLVDDINHTCYSADWMPYGLAGTAAFVLFLFGFPAACFCVLYYYRDHHEDSAFQAQFTVLYDAYCMQFWYGQTVSYFRKFVLIGSIMFLSPGSTTQTAIAFCLAYFSMISHIKTAPYCDTAVNRMQMISELTLVLTLFCGLGLQVHFCKEEHGTSKMVLTGCLVVTNILAAVLVVYLMVQYMIKSKANIIKMQKYAAKLENVKVLSGWSKWRDVYSNESAMGCLSESALAVLKRKAIYDHESRSQSNTTNANQEAQTPSAKRTSVKSRRTATNESSGSTNTTAPRRTKWQRKTTDQTPTQIVIESSPRSSVETDTSTMHKSTLRSSQLQSVMDASKKKFCSESTRV